MGLFSIIRSMFKSSSISDSPSADDSSNNFTETEDYGVNPSTGLPMISRGIDAGGYMLGEQPSTFDSSDSSSSLFDDSSSSISSFDDSSSCASAFARESGSSFDSSSSMYDSVSSSSIFDD